MYGSLSRDVIAAMLEDNNNRLLASNVSSFNMAAASWCFGSWLQTIYSDHETAGRSLAHCYDNMLQGFEFPTYHIQYTFLSLCQFFH